MYIVLEGLDGTGKTTLFENLKSYFVIEKYSFETCCPTRIYDSNSFIERLYKSNVKYKRNQLFRTIIFAYRSYKASKNVNWKTDLILGDRSVIVSYIKLWRQFFNLPNITVIVVNILEPFIKAPDLIIYLHAPFTVIQDRLLKKEKLEIDETPEKLLAMSSAYNEIRFCYKIFRLRKTKWIDINSNREPDILAKEVFDLIKKVLESN